MKRYLLGAQWSASEDRRVPALLLAVAFMLVSVGFLSACSLPSQAPKGPVEVATGFVKNYDAWARTGYADPIPDLLREAATSEMLEVLEDDQNWYLTGGVKQHGEVEIVETELIESGVDRAVVRVTLDATAVSVTAQGEETFVDYAKPIVTRLNLESGEGWRITSTESED